MASEFDDSLLARDPRDVPRTPLEEGIRQTAEIFERLKREGHLDTGWTNRRLGEAQKERP